MDQLNAAVFLGFLFGVLATLSLWLLVRLLKPRPRPGRLEIDPRAGAIYRDRLKALTPALLVLSLACTPAQRAGARTALRTALDFAKCELAGGGSPLVKSVAAELASDPAASARYRSALAQGADLRIGGVSVGAQDAMCLLALLATVIPQSGQPHGEGPVPLIMRRAELCRDGGCERPEDRAASILHGLWRVGRLRLPPSGEG